MTQKELQTAFERNGLKRIHPAVGEKFDPHQHQAVMEQTSSEVGPGGVIDSWAWVSHPLRKHPLQTPFAWALITLDGADTGMLHAVQAPGPEALATGARVTAKFRAEADRIGAMADIEAFVLEGGAS